MKTKNLSCFPNPFARLDHEGVPAAAYPFDPSHSPDRRWVGAVIDRSAGPGGVPRTRQLDTEGDLTTILPKVDPKTKRPLYGARGGQAVYVDRAPRKRIAFAFDLAEPTVVPPTSHYLLGFRQGSLIPADEATAKALGVPFVEPKVALAAAAAKALAVWEQEQGEPADVSAWPKNLQAAAGLTGKPAPEEKPVAPSEPVPEDVGLAVVKTEGAAHAAGGGVA